MAAPGATLTDALAKTQGGAIKIADHDHKGAEKRKADTECSNKHFEQYL
jgi:hypothetical protein